MQKIANKAVTFIMVEYDFIQYFIYWIKGNVSFHH